MNKFTALLVIDVQLAAFSGELAPACYKSKELLDNLTTLIASARKAEIPVIFIQHCGAPGQLYAEGTDQWIIHPAIAPNSTEIVVQKRESSAFDGTELQSILEQKRIIGIITCGLQSEHCVSNTSIAALDLGLEVYVAEDAHSTWSGDDDAAVIIARQNALLSELGAKLKDTKSLAELITTS